MDPDNPIVQLCVQGMRDEGEGWYGKIVRDGKMMPAGACELTPIVEPLGAVHCLKARYIRIAYQN
jgi:hypothetical protein